LIKSAIIQLYPRTAHLPGAEDCDLDAFLAKYRRDTTALIWVGVVLGALVYQLSPLFTIGVPLPAFALSADRADQHAHAISGSNVYLVRQTVFLLKLVAGLAWGQHPGVRAHFALSPLPSDPHDWRIS
jgi:hypothetical protein